MLRYRVQIKQFTGEIAFAEKHLGSGGTNTLIVIIAVVIFTGTLMYSLGTLQAIMDKLLGGFF